MTQYDRVLEYIQEFGSITSLEAFKDLGVTRLSAAIFTLQEQGYRFTREWENTRNRYGDKVRYIRYSLKD